MKLDSDILTRKLADAPEDTALPVDRDVALAKRSMMKKLKKNSLFNSIAETCKFIAGPIFGLGLGAGMASVAASGAFFTATAGVLIATGLAVALTSVVAGYVASRVWQSGQFDNFELNAQSTAHHLVKELKGNNMCLVEQQEAPKRADGKSWCQYTRDRATQAQALQTSV